MLDNVINTSKYGEIKYEFESEIVNLERKNNEMGNLDWITNLIANPRF